MAFDEIEIVPGKFLYRCDGCGYEHPTKPVDKHHLGRPPITIAPTESGRTRSITRTRTRPPKQFQATR
jgi:hypothetical protein